MLRLHFLPPQNEAIARVRFFRKSGGDIRSVFRTLRPSCPKWKDLVHPQSSLELFELPIEKGLDTCLTYGIEAARTKTEYPSVSRSSQQRKRALPF
jgi:hypothetical protein